MAAATVVLVLAFAPRAGGEVSTTATPIYHGRLDIVRARGTIDRKTTLANLSVRRSRFLLRTPESDGIFPDREPVVVAIGDNDAFYLPPGALKPFRHGRSFVYRGPRDAGPHAIRSFRLSRRQDGSYAVSFRLTGVVLYQLNVNDPICKPLAVIVGNDDGFTGADITSPRFTSRQLSIRPVPCDVSGDWPWIQN